MDWNTILSLISAVGFPIVACIALMYYVREQTSANREDMKALNEQHLNEMMTFKDALNNNTVALIKLCEKLDVDMGDK